MTLNLTRTQKALFAEVWNRRSTGGTTLRELALATKLAPPSALAQLRKLLALKLIARDEGKAGSPTYLPRPFFEATLVDPGGGVVDSWQVTELPDWRFPFVSRVPDPAARSSLVLFLGLAWERGLLLPKSPPKHGGKIFRGVTLVVYGSCATGTARAGSDVDVVGILGPGGPAPHALKDLVAEANLRVERKIDARFLPADEYLALPEALRRDLRSGKTVFRSSEESPFVEDPS